MLDIDGSHMKSLSVFFALLQSGLWKREAGLAQHGEVYRLAEEQSVVGRKQSF